ncbi:MAG: FAD-dependent oxidoreductase [Myxococcota bacterium]
MGRGVLRDDADFIVVGTGAGGATAAHVLSRAGHSVLLVEEGPKLTASERPTELLRAMSIGVRDMGSQTTAGATPMPLLQGRLVGGSTAINSGIIWRMPDDVRNDWQHGHGLGSLVGRGLDRAFESIEADLDVAVTSEQIRGGNADRMAKASEILDLPGKPITRNARNCQGRAHCLQGCPHEARQSMDVSYIPGAVRAGARLHPNCRVERVSTKDGRAVGVSGLTLDPDSRRRRGRFDFRARRGVIVAAGVVHTPVILRKSGLQNRRVGQHFQAHPGCAVVGRFDDSIGMGQGATQGYEVPLRDRGFKLESISLPPEMLASRIPGVGAEWQARLGRLDQYAQWAAQIRMRAQGTVTVGFRGAPVVRYEPLAEDLLRARAAAALICRMMFAAGAIEVYPGLFGVDEALTDVAQVREIEERHLPREAFHFMASHLFGTARAGVSSATSVVGPNLESHDVAHLYVMDASVFPTNLGVNPQHSIMAVVHQAAEQLAERALSRVA